MEHISGSGYEIRENTFQRNSTHVAYPIIVSEANSEKVDAWNKIILQDIGSILNIYSDYTMTPAPEERGLYLPDTLRITYDIKRNDNRYLSILYIADFYSPYAAYPTQMIYTTNIDKENNRRVKLSDFITDVKSLADEINFWDIVTKDYDIKDYPQLVRDYIKGLGKEILLMGFESADIIGPDNYLEIYSYLTPDKLGVSISVPHYLGDHAEFERTIPTE
ncbi:MAG: DUF4163 domain-containing protein [Clostridiales bacterium]|jgi:hypothetical protein|nr:DUF4163 domain-containing protein [Clostridiales bacterium]